MATREQARIEAAFARGDVGIDGGATEEVKDQAEVEQQKAKDELTRGSTFLGREFLTWLLWRTESGTPLVHIDKQPVSVLIVGKLTLKGLAGDVTEVQAKGAMAAYSPMVRRLIDRGLLVHQARLQITHGERAYEVTLDAEQFDLRSGKLPDLMTEDDDDPLHERLYLTEQLSGLVTALVDGFIEVRTSPRWKKQVVGDLKGWLQEQPVLAAEPMAAPKAKGSKAAPAQVVAPAEAEIEVVSKPAKKPAKGKKA
jgi:hypothetical protein